VEKRSKKQASHFSSNSGFCVKILDAMYYGVYCFSRRLKNAPMEAESWACIWMPFFFVGNGIVGYFLYTAVRGTRMVPRRIAGPYLIGICMLLFAVSYFVYEKKGRGEKLIAEYQKTKNQRLYFWLGGFFFFGPGLFLAAVILWGILRG
jgi:hypothetical protein